MSTATLSGHRVTHARVHLPAWGIPWAEVSLDEEVALAGRCTLVVADLTLIGTVMSGGAGPVGRSSYRVAGGAGSWGRTLPAKSYANDAGVKASTVLVDTASACGETVDAATVPMTRIGTTNGPAIVGAAWTREAGPASRVLEQLFEAGWFIGTDGVTRIGKRPRVELAAGVPVVSIDRARGVLTLAPESIAALVPGIVVEGLEAVDVLHELTPSGLRSTIWASGIGNTSRRLVALRRVIEQLDPNRAFRGTYEYRVVLQTVQPTREWLDLQPVRVSTGMPALQRVSMRPGIPGARALVALGSRVLVTFADADPSRPVLVAFEAPDQEGWLPVRLELDATAIQVGGVGALAAARVTDPVVCGAFGGSITSGSTKVSIN